MCLKIFLFIIFVVNSFPHYFSCLWDLFYINYIFSLQDHHSQSSDPTHIAPFQDLPSDLQTVDISALLTAIETFDPLPPLPLQQQGGGVVQQGGQIPPPIPSTSSPTNSSIRSTPPPIDSITNNLQVIPNPVDDLYNFLENALMSM